jgi:hypothetical protein
MKRYWIEYTESWKDVPMAYWVHREVDTDAFYSASVFDPPAPVKKADGSYIIYFVEFNGNIFRFSSTVQYNHFVEVLSQKVLPRPLDLAAERSGSHGPNSHWLSRLPAKVKAWKHREKLCGYLRSIRDELFTLDE